MKFLSITGYYENVSDITGQHKPISEKFKFYIDDLWCQTFKNVRLYSWTHLRDDDNDDDDTEDERKSVSSDDMLLISSRLDAFGERGKGYFQIGHMGGKSLCL